MLPNINFNVKCNQKNHQNEEKVAICLQKECKANRLLCWKCLKQFHFDHYQCNLGISDIKNGSVENYPFDENLGTILKEFNSSSFDQLISKLNSFFDIFTANFLKEIDSIKKRIITKINFKEDLDVILNLKTELNKAISLTPVIDALNDINNDNFLEKEEDFDKKIKKFVSEENEPRVNSISLVNKYYKDWSTKYQFFFDEIQFQKVTKDLLECLNQFDNVLRKKKISIIDMQFSGAYIANGAPVGTNNYNDLLDASLQKGICANTPGWIVFEFQNEVTFKSLKIAGYHGNSIVWGLSNGSGADILISSDKNNWKSIGKIPNLTEKNIETIAFPSYNTAKFLKFNHNNYLGIGYLELYL